MNKLFTKIVGATLGFAMAIGVGVAVANRNDVVATNATETTDTINASSLAATGTTYTAFTNKSYSSSAKYAGKTSKVNSSYIQIKSGNSDTGIVSTTSGGYLAKVELTWNSSNMTQDRQLDVYGKGSNYSAATDLYGNSQGTKIGSLYYYVNNTNGTTTTVLNVSGSYTSVGIRSYSNALSFKDLKITWSDSVPSTASLSNITATKTALSVGDNTGATLSLTATNRGDNVVSWTASPSSGVSFSNTSASGEQTTIKFASGNEALAAGTEVTVTASLTGASSKTIKLCAIGNAGSQANPYKAIEAKYLALDGDTGSHYVAAYIVSFSGDTSQNVWLNDNAEATKGDFELYNGYTNNTDVDLAVGQFILAHGTFAKYNTTAEATGSEIDRVDYIVLANASLEVNYTQSTTLSVTTAGGDVAWSTVAGTGSVSLSNESNSSVTITGTSVGTATVTATVGTASANCTVTVVEYAEDWTFVSITLSTGSGFVSSYTQGADFDKTGITVTYVEHSDTLNKNRSLDRTNEATYNFDDHKNTVGQFNLTATYGGHTTTDVVTITITKVPGVVNFGSTTGYYALSATPASYTDNLSHTVTGSITTNGNVTNSATYSTIGNGSGNSTIIFTVDLGSGSANRKGIESVSVSARTTKQSGSLTTLVYADEDENNVILSGTHAQSTTPISTGASYQTINANKICFKVSSESNGIQIYSISYTTGDKVQEFGVLDKIEIKNTSIHETTFKVDQVFSTAGLIIVATDKDDFTKEYTSGFSTDYDGHTFIESEVANNVTVTVSLTIGGVTKTTTYTINIINPPTYSAASEIYEGMKVLLVDTAGYAVGAASSSSYAVVTDMVSDNGTITDPSDALEFTVRIYGDKFALQFSNKYLSYSGSSNDAYSSTTLGDNESWRFDDDGLLWCGDESAGRYFQINGSLKAACYTGTQKHLTMYVSSASSKTDELAADTFIYRYLHMRDYSGTEGQAGSGYCKNTGDGAGKNYYADAVTAYAGLTTAVKTEFKKNAAAVKRFQDWATANGYTFNPDADTFTKNSRFAFGDVVSENNVAMIIVVISMISITAFAGYMILRKKKEQ